MTKRYNNSLVKCLDGHPYEDLGDLCNVSRQAVCNWVHGTVPSNPYLRELIIEAFIKLTGVRYDHSIFTTPIEWDVGIRKRKPNVRHRILQKIEGYIERGLDAEFWQTIKSEWAKYG